ncbi:MAG TPA: DUF1326 domain-containing protein [Terriglobia bacterium]|nr:DUF1326 domain-containing protein [Terriglobia bacterium]
MKPLALGAILAVLTCALPAPAADTAQTVVRKPHGEHWEMAGQLSEACSCAVPCTCNFAQGPSPHRYCRSMFALDIEHGHYGAVSLDGLHLVGAQGKKSQVWYIDRRATPAQAAALRSVTLDLDWHSTKPRFWEVAEITQTIGDKSHEVEVRGRGGFTADYLIGMDGKTPIVVENNTSWNIQHGVKAKARTLQYQDEHGNKYRYAGVNSNEGRFDWTDQTPTYF